MKISNNTTISILDEQSIDALFDFRERVFPQNDKQLDKKRWDWLFRQNPETTGTTIPTWVLRNGKQVVGSVSSIFLRVKVGVSVFTCSFGSDYFVDKMYLGLPALRLLKIMQKQSQVNIGANLSASAAKLFKKMKYTDLSENVKVVTAFFPKNNQSSLSIKSFIKYYVYKIIRRFFCFKKFNKRITCILPKSAQMLWENLSPHLYVSVVKDYNYLKWRYKQCLSVDYRFIILETKKQMVALAVLTIQQEGKNGKRGLIADILVDPDDFFASCGIINACLEFFQEKGCTLCFTHLLNDRMLRYFKIMGFNVSKSDLGLMVLLPKHNNQELQGLVNSAKWSFWIGDTDRY